MQVPMGWVDGGRGGGWLLWLAQTLSGKCSLQVLLVTQRFSKHVLVVLGCLAHDIGWRHAADSLRAGRFGGGLRLF